MYGCKTPWAYGPKPNPKMAKGGENSAIRILFSTHHVSSHLSLKSTSTGIFAPPRRRRRSWPEQPNITTNLLLSTSSFLISHQFPQNWNFIIYNCKFFHILLSIIGITPYLYIWVCLLLKQSPNSQR